MYKLEDAYSPPGGGFDIYEAHYSAWQSHYVATSVDLYAMWQANSHNGSSIWVGNNEAKIRITLIKK